MLPAAGYRRGLGGTQRRKHPHIGMVADMALSISYVDVSGVSVDWSTAVSGGVAAIDIYQVTADDQHSNRFLWARAGQAVPASRVATAQADTFPAGGRARTGTLTTSTDVVNAGAGTAYRVLPAGAASGTVRGVQNNGEGIVYVDAPGTDTIDGGTAPVLVHAGEVAQFQANGSGAWVRLLAASTLLNGTYAQILTPATGLTYNPDGSVATQTIAGVTTSYTYNTDGTVATEVRAGVTRTYTYNTDGTLASVA